MQHMQDHHIFIEHKRIDTTPCENTCEPKAKAWKQDTTYPYSNNVPRKFH